MQLLLNKARHLVSTWGKVTVFVIAMRDLFF
jgi:hypothetical protein